MSAAEPPCYMLVSPESDGPDCLSESALRSVLERGDLKAKTEALKKVMVRMLSGERLPGLIMSVIRYVLPLQDHAIKKLLLLFWEAAPRTGADGQPLQEMILVCDAYRKDLQHPNPFVRGSALRLLSKLREPHLLEPLVPAARACLEHPHAYVRRNAILAVDAVARRHAHLVPDAAELARDLLVVERDAGCRRNALGMLVRADQRRAAEYLSACVADEAAAFPDDLQLAAAELMRSVGRRRGATGALPEDQQQQHRARFVRCAYSLLQPAHGPAVRYEAAATLAAMSRGAPAAVCAAARCYAGLAVGESDNNVKLVVLDRLAALLPLGGRQARDPALRDLAMDVLRVLNTSSDPEVRRKTLRLTLDLASPRDAEALAGALTKELSKARRRLGAVDDTVGEYCRLLVRALRSCATRFPDTAALVLPALTALLGDDSGGDDDEEDETVATAAGDALEFVRHAAQRLEHLRPLAVRSVLEVFPRIRSAKTYRGALWILGEYCSAAEDIRRVVGEVSRSLGEEDEVALDVAEDGEKTGEARKKKLLTEMGTYATQSALGSFSSSFSPPSAPPTPLRAFLAGGDDSSYVAAALAAALTKLVLRYDADSGGSEERAATTKDRNSLVAEAMLLMAAALRLASQPVAEDCAERVRLCMRAVSGVRSTPVARAFAGGGCRKALERVLTACAGREGEDSDGDEEKLSRNESEKTVEVDQPIVFAHLSAAWAGPTSHTAAKEDEDELPLALSAMAAGRTPPSSEAYSNELARVSQLTGFSDPVYAEVVVRAERYDVTLDVLLVNRTSDTLQNVALELASSADLRLVAGTTATTPSALPALGPHGRAQIRAVLKVASAAAAESGGGGGRTVYGNVVYDAPGAGGGRRCIVLSEVRVDEAEGAARRPGDASCSDAQFRRMWADFEWENKVAVDTDATDAKEYLARIAAASNMHCLTPADSSDSGGGGCGFMAANLYMRSVFGEDVLANVSVEKPPRQDPTGPEPPVTGHIRIRAKNKAMVLSLANKINLSQKRLSAF